MMRFPKKRVLTYSAVLVVLLAAIGMLASLLDWRALSGQAAAVALAVPSPFLYSFKIDGVLQETGSMGLTTSPYWWVNSGGQLILKDGTGMTMQGTAPTLSRWRIAYASANPRDTDDGIHPQNLFRLVSRSVWDNVRAEGFFRIEADNLSSSENRAESNGLLLMSRYALDGQTLYYAGIRVDGTAVIKKKYRGTYYTMAQKAVFPGSYDRAISPNLLPHAEWIGLRSETTTKDGTVTVRLFMRREGENAWTELLSATDDGRAYGGTPVIAGPGYVGIRTDFMDVSFKTLRFEKL